MSIRAFIANDACSIQERIIVYNESSPSVLEEAGEIIIALENGAIKADDLYAEIGELINGNKQGRQSPDDITFFKSVGVAVQDAIAGSIALKNAEAMDIGTLLEMD